MSDKIQKLGYPLEGIVLPVQTSRTDYSSLKEEEAHQASPNTLHQRRGKAAEDSESTLLLKP